MVAAGFEEGAGPRPQFEWQGWFMSSRAGNGGAMAPRGRKRAEAPGMRSKALGADPARPEKRICGRFSLDGSSAGR